MNRNEQARKAANEIRKLSIKNRLGHVQKLRSLILGKQEEIILRIQNETGKSHADALMSEIFPALDYLSFLEKYTELALRDEVVKTPVALLGKKSLITYEPLGVVLVITPWNYPFYQGLVPCLTAFATGNACIFKPSEFTPLKGLFEELFKAADMGEHWIQVVYGDGKIGSSLIAENPDKVFFTGGTATGKKIMQQCAEHLIPVELELGGKDPMIVFDDVNLDRATSGALWGAFTNLGQSCTSVERVYVHEKIYTQFRDLLVAKAKQLKQEPNADIGTMTTDRQTQIVRDQISGAKKAGAKLLVGEKNLDGTGRKITPTILENVTTEMKVLAAETFGPILPLIAFKTEEEAVALANASEYGLSASVWSKDLNRAVRVARALNTGNVSINNVMLTEANPHLPFGGVKQSGFGRAKGRMGFHGFCNIKSVLIDKDSSKIEANWFPYDTQKETLFNGMMAALFGKTSLFAFLKFAFFGIKLESYSKKLVDDQKK